MRAHSWFLLRSSFCHGTRVAGVAVLAALGLPALAFAQPRDLQASPASARLRMLNAAEANAIITAANEHRQSRTKDSDCSHLVHEIYQQAGFKFPYAKSSDLYAGIEHFARVQAPQRGDLIVWPGHVGIVVEPALRAFYSSLRAGLRLEFYDTPYWRRRGRARFYRYVAHRMDFARDSALPSKTPSAVAANIRQPEGPTRDAEAIRITSAISSAPAGEAAWYGRIPILTAGASPTRGEIEAAIAGLSGAITNAAHDLDLLNLKQPALVVDRMEVEGFEIKKQRGWALIRTHIKLTIAGGRADLRSSRESRRWELRQTGDRWFLLAPQGRTYVHRDVAIRLLAAQLASLARPKAATGQQVDGRQVQAVRLLGAVVEQEQ